MALNPVAHVEKIDETDDVRRARRALSVDELHAFLAVVKPMHQLAYRVLLSTGLRRAELAALVWGDVKLNAPRPFIQLRASTTKAGRADVLPVRQDLADELRAARGDAGDADHVVRAVPGMDTHKDYLTKAKIAYVDDQGRRADVHAMRHSYGSMIAKAGIAPRVAMSLMRHTDMKLTMNVYTDPRVFDMAGAVEQLPSLTPADAAVAQATGTDGEAADARHMDANEWRSKRRSSPKAGLGVRSAVIGEHGREGEATLSLANDGVRRQTAGIGGEGEKAARLGLEPTANLRICSTNQQIPTAGAAKGAAAVCPPVPADPDLALVVDRWASLPAALRAGILVMVRGTPRTAPDAVNESEVSPTVADAPAAQETRTATTGGRDLVVE
jgi:hypothetical protein